MTDRNFAIVVQHQWSGSHLRRFRPFMITVDRITRCFVFALSRPGNYAVRYDKKVHKFQFFATEDEAQQALIEFNERTGTTAAVEAEIEADTKRNYATEQVKQAVKDWPDA